MRYYLFSVFLYYLLEKHPCGCKHFMLRMIMSASEGAHPEGSNRHMLSHILVEQSCLATERRIDWDILSLVQRSCIFLRRFSVQKERGTKPLNIFLVVRSTKEKYTCVQNCTQLQHPSNCFCQLLSISLQSFFLGNFIPLRCNIKNLEAFPLC